MMERTSHIVGFVFILALLLGTIVQIKMIDGWFGEHYRQTACDLWGLNCR
jgi:hypothetical protein